MEREEEGKEKEERGKEDRREGREGEKRERGMEEEMNKYYLTCTVQWCSDHPPSGKVLKADL